MNARLAAAGWKATPSGRWIHPDAPPLAGNRRRLFTEAEALTLLAADTDEDTQEFRPAETVNELLPITRQGLDLMALARNLEEARQM